MIKGGTCSFFLDDATVVLNPPLTPAELLVALHTVESESDVKAVMKGESVLVVGQGGSKC